MSVSCVCLLQSPPWIFIDYTHKSSQPQQQQNLSSIDSDYDSEEQKDDNDHTTTRRTRRASKEFRVSGRDDTLLKVLARKMNFNYEYIDAKTIEMDENVTVPGALGLQMLQKRVSPRLSMRHMTQF
jgi:hypothetical protein